MFGDSLRAPRMLPLMFLAAMLLLAATLGWLAWRLLTQDRQLSVQRLAEQREITADLVIAALEKRLSGVERALDQALAIGELPKSLALSGAIVVGFQAGSVRAWPEKALLYYPDPPEALEAPPALFARADELEFRKRDYSSAIAALSDLAASNNPKIRAAALAGRARNYLKSGQPQVALRTYAALAALGPVPVVQIPAALAARVGELAVFGQQNAQASLLVSARKLRHDLNSGLAPISYATYMYLSEEANSRLPVQERQPDPRVALAEGVQWLWENRDHTHGGRSSLTMQSGSVTLLWRVSGTALAGFVAGSEYLENQWIAEMKRMAEARQVRLFLGDALGNTLGAGTSRPAIRPASVTQLPWTIQILNTGDDGGALRSRRNLLLAGMGVLLLLILTGGWFTGRTVARELAVARLQSDFVSAVSHEFRTPLTTLCQLSELLKRDRVASDEDRRQYYELLNNESHRLRRLVESLLNFGRLEAGKMHLRFEELDAAALVRELATEFAGGPQARGHRFEVLTPTDLPMVRADRETLRCVFWNLFENAAKYSPNCDTVWVELAQSDVQVEIKVRDQGVGIPRGEQRRIFEKFVRGTAARASDVRGTGIGLALARQIVRAHGGDITLESEPGQGSTFRVALPGKSS